MSWWGPSWYSDSWSSWDDHGRDDGRGRWDDGWWWSGGHESHQNWHTPETPPEPSNPESEHDELPGDLNYSYLGNSTKHSNSLPPAKQADAPTLCDPEQRRASRCQETVEAGNACIELYCTGGGVVVRGEVT